MQIQPSNITAQRFGEVRPPRPEPTPDARGREADVSATRDRADLGTTTPAPGQSPAERVASFAATIEQRITNLAEESGQDLSEVQAAFGGFVDRIQNGLADGSLGGADLERGVRNALALTTSGVREALAAGVEPREDSVARPAEDVEVRDEGVTRPVGQSPTERIDAFEQRINERLGAIAEGADTETIAALREAQQAFAAGLEGLREGLDQGRAESGALGAAVQSAIASLGDSVQAALAEPADGPARIDAPLVEVERREADSPEENSLAPRFDAFAQQIAERIGNLDLSGPQGGAVRAAGADFLSLLEDLSSESENGTLTAERAASVFQGALSDFSGDLAQLFGRSDEGLALYGRNAERTA